MAGSKWQSAALFFTIFGSMLILPPLALLFNKEMRVGGLPTEMIYLFVVWLGLVVASAWFAYRLPHEPADEKPEERE